jgi:hypothetical protein
MAGMMGDRLRWDSSNPYAIDRSTIFYFLETITYLPNSIRVPWVERCSPTASRGKLSLFPDRFLGHRLNSLICNRSLLSQNSDGGRGDRSRPSPPAQARRHTGTCRSAAILPSRGGPSRTGSGRRWALSGRVSASLRRGGPHGGARRVAPGGAPRGPPWVVPGGATATRPAAPAACSAQGTMRVEAESPGVAAPGPAPRKPRRAPGPRCRARDARRGSLRPRGGQGWLTGLKVVGSS